MIYTNKTVRKNDQGNTHKTSINIDELEGHVPSATLLRRSHEHTHTSMHACRKTRAKMGFCVRIKT